MEGRDKAKDDDLVNFQQKHELEYIAKQYLSLTWNELQNMESAIKSAYGKRKNQQVTHEEAYEYLEGKKHYRIMEPTHEHYQWVSDHLRNYIKACHKSLYDNTNTQYQAIIDEKIEELNPKKVEELVKKRYRPNSNNTGGEPLTHKEVYELLYKHLLQKLGIKR